MRQSGQTITDIEGIRYPSIVDINDVKRKDQDSLNEYEGQPIFVQQSVETNKIPEDQPKKSNIEEPKKKEE